MYGPLALRLGPNSGILGSHRTSPRSLGWKKGSRVLRIPGKAPSCPTGDKLLSIFSSLRESTRSQVPKPVPSFPFWRPEEPACASGSHGNRACASPSFPEGLGALACPPYPVPPPFHRVSQLAPAVRPSGAKTLRLLIPRGRKPVPRGEMTALSSVHQDFSLGKGCSRPRALWERGRQGPEASRSGPVFPAVFLALGKFPRGRAD